MRQALVLAEESGDEPGAMRACMNLSYLLSLAGRNAEAEAVIERASSSHAAAATEAVNAP